MGWSIHTERDIPMETRRFIMASSFYPPYHLGGDAIHVKQLSEALANKGHDVHVIHSIDAYRVKRKEIPEPLGSNVRVHSLDSPYGSLTPLKVYCLGDSRFILTRYEKLVAEIKPDVVHHHNISLLGRGLLKKRGEYLQLYTAHDHWLICQRNDMMRGDRPCQYKKCKSCALSSFRFPQLWRKQLDVSDIDFLLCASSYMANALKELELRTVVLPNFSTEPPVSIPDIPDDDFYLYLGVIDEHKGIRELLNAFSASDKKLIILGRGSMSDWVEGFIKKRKLEPRVRYLGWMTEKKWSFLKKANAVLIPSTGRENHPLVALEALSVGTPVICSDRGGTKEIVRLMSPELVLPTNKLEDELRTLQVPKISRERVKEIYEEHFTVNRYLQKYDAIVREGYTST
jgi:glycosyltransferase involved in cell wall biosynthesis